MSAPRIQHYIQGAMNDDLVLRHAAMLGVFDSSVENGVRHPGLELAVTPCWRFSPDQTHPKGLSAALLQLLFDNPADVKSFEKSSPKYDTRVLFWHNGRSKEAKDFFLQCQLVGPQDKLREWTQNNWMDVIYIDSSADASRKAQQAAQAQLDDRDQPVPMVYRNCFQFDLRNILRAAEFSMKNFVMGWKPDDGLSAQKRIFRAYAEIVPVKGGSSIQNRLFVVGHTPIVNRERKRDGEGKIVKDEKGKPVIENKPDRPGKLFVFSEQTWIEIFYSYLTGMSTIPPKEGVPSPYQLVMADLERRGPWPGFILSQAQPETLELEEATVQGDDEVGDNTVEDEEAPGTA